ncbi:6569_t:CDS:1, partial [Racocetra persica]
KLIREGYKYVDRLSDYLEDIRTIYVEEFELDLLADFYYPALILPLSVLAIRADIRENFIISMESAVMGGMSLFTLEKNKRSSLQNLIQMNYFIDNFTTLIRITWEQEEMKT